MPDQERIAQLVRGAEEQDQPVVNNAIRNIATAMVETSAEVQQDQNVLIWFDYPLGLPLAHELHSGCLARGAQTTFFMRDLQVDARQASSLPMDELQHYFDGEKRLIDNADVVLIVRAAQDPEIMNAVPPERREVYAQGYANAHQARIEGTVDWTLILWPTLYEARVEGIPFEEYFQIFLEACNQPWDQIKQAQSLLVEKLNARKKLELIANPHDSNPNKRTRLTMSMEGMTFANSTIDKNIPGSEVFSAPVLESVNGQIYAPGDYIYDGFRMSDIFLKVKNGQITTAYAGSGNNHLQTILARGSGARYFGEVALGTNPGLTRRLFNSLLNEKVGGSFHMAIGHCYSFAEYNGIPVKVNNGNTSDKTSVHWDLTVLMHAQYGGGAVILDNRVIQENGAFYDPKLEILNPKL